MSNVTIRVRPNGPLLIEGPVTIVDQNGNSFPLNPDKPAVALCRCGQSAKRPFCDGTHKTCGFQSIELAPVAPSG
jgi:CDGSH iron-sulfur domain-containing protein 3